MPQRRTYRRLRARFWLESALAALAILSSAAVLVEPHWIEEFLHASPDGGSGELEAVVPLVLGLAAIVMSLVAAREWLRSRPAAV